MKDKTTRYAQQIVFKKTWWQKLLFWKKFKEVINTAQGEIKVSYWRFEQIPCRLYRQNDQTAPSVDHVENDCEYLGELPSSKGIEIIVGHKYWLVIDKKTVMKSLNANGL